MRPRISGTHLKIRGIMKLFKNTILMLVCLSIVLSGSCITAFAASGVDDIIMNDVFSDHMVLQRQKPVEIYGTVRGGADVTVTFSGQTKTTTADADGNFSVYLDAMEANATGSMLKIESGSAKKIFLDVVVGEVYYGSGQSNMAYPMDEFTYAESVLESDSSYEEDYEKYKNKPSYLEDFNDYKNYKNLRFYTQKMMPETTGVKNQGTLNEWIKVSNVNELKYTSLTAVAYAMRLSDALGGIPVGVIVSGVGGSRIHEWISREAANEIYPGNSDSTLCQRYENMLVPMGRFTIRGVLWYQGESDVYDTTKYKACFNKWVEETRSFFNDENLPIITFQLPQFEDIYCAGLWPAFRQIQEELANEIDGVYYVCGIDLGDHKNIHPTDKYELCGRAVAIALKYIYELPYSGEGAYGLNPVASNLYRKTGTKTVYMTFDNAEEITISNENTTGLVATTNGQTTSAISSYKKVGTKIVSFETKLKYVSYLQANIFDYSTAFMYNEYGLPVAPFVNKEVQTYDYDVTVNLVGCTSDGEEHYFAKSGDNVSFIITPKDGYEFVSLKINGSDVDFNDGKIKLTNISADTDIECVFENKSGEPDELDTPIGPGVPDTPIEPDTPVDPDDKVDDDNNSGGGSLNGGNNDNQSGSVDDNDGDNDNVGLIVGLTVGAVVLVAAGVVAVILIKKRRQV